MWDQKINDIFQIKSLKKFGKAQEAILFKKCKMDKFAYFDFETTTAPSNIDFFTKKLSKNETARDQITFCVSYLFDINFRVRDYAYLL